MRALDHPPFSVSRPGLPARAAALATLWVQIAAMFITIALPAAVNPWGSEPVRESYNFTKLLVLLGLTAAMAIGWGFARLVARSPAWKITLPEIPLLVYVLFVFLSTSTSVSAVPTFFGAPWRNEGLLAILSYVFLYFVGVHFFGSGSGFRRVVATASAAAIVVSAYGVVQLFLPLLFPGEIRVMFIYGTLGTLRPGSLVGGPTSFAGYLCLMTPLLLSLGLAGTGRGRWLWLAGVVLGVTGLVMSLTRGAWLGFVLGAVVFAAAAGRGTLRRHWRELIAVLAALAIILPGLVTAFVAPGTMTNRLSTPFDPESASSGGRLGIWQGTVYLIRQRPLLGWGLETLSRVFPYDRPSFIRQFGPGPQNIDRAHNDVLHVAVSIGIPGAVAYLGFWSLVVVAAARIWRRATGSTRIVAVGWLAALTGYSMHVQFAMSNIAYTPLVWLLAGAASGWEASGRNQSEPTQTLPVRVVASRREPQLGWGMQPNRPVPPRAGDLILPGKEGSQ